MPLTQLKSPPRADARVTLKLESLQVTGSFKARGAMNPLLGTPLDQLRAGIVTASGGNHGLAVARTAHAANVSAVVYVPKSVSPVKVAKMKKWSADVRILGDDWNQSNVAALEHAARTGAVYFHRFADPLVVAGQGTLGLEVLDDLPDMDAIIDAIGGGGLISGIGTAIRVRRACGQDRRRGTSWLADPEGEPRCRSGGDIGGNSVKGGDHVVPADRRAHF